MIRLLAGELSEAEAAQLRKRLESDGELQLVFASMRERWEALDPPPLPEVHSSFTSRVVRRAADGPTFAAAPLGRSTPLWTRATAALALAGGILVGVMLASPSESEDWAAWSAVELTQAETYWETLGESSDDLLQEELR
jgi:anti-sigma factor RsiW